MGARNKQEAADKFSTLFKESLSCITDAHLQPLQKSTNLYVLSYEPAVALRCNKGERSLSVTHVFTPVPDRVKGGFKASTRKYIYGLNDEAGREMVEYHWHPEQTDVHYPHLHVHHDPIRRVHFATARVSVEMFIRMLIDYYGIEPIIAESKWRAIFEKEQQSLR